MPVRTGGAARTCSCHRTRAPGPLGFDSWLATINARSHSLRPRSVGPQRVVFCQHHRVMQPERLGGRGSRRPRGALHLHVLPGAAGSGPSAGSSKLTVITWGVRRAEQLATYQTIWCLYPLAAGARCGPPFAAFQPASAVAAGHVHSGKTTSWARSSPCLAPT